MNGINEKSYQEKLALHENGQDEKEFIESLTDLELRRYIAERYLKNRKPEIEKDSPEYNLWRDVIMKTEKLETFIDGAYYENDFIAYTNFDEYPWKVSEGFHDEYASFDNDDEIDEKSEGVGPYAHDDDDDYNY